VKVDEARNRDADCPGRGNSQPGDDAVLDVDVPVDALAADERSLDAQPHASTSGLDQ
jgi:hypothetical protein